MMTCIKDVQISFTSLTMLFAIMKRKASLLFPEIIIASSGLMTGQSYRSRPLSTIVILIQVYEHTLTEKIDIWAVSKLMGHNDITQITQTYGHLVQEKADEENARVRKLLSSLNKKKIR